MRHRIPANKLLIFCLSSLLAAGCGSPAAQVSMEPTTVQVAAPEAHAYAAAYHERLRLGLGSPYRLIETALHDDRLGEDREVVARALLARIEHGELYQISPLVLVGAGASEASAIVQLDLIDQAITSATDPRVGDLAVNLAYELAVAERAVTPAVAARVARVAALVRDRELARSDALRLRQAARRQGASPEGLVPLWRMQRWFLVEQPTLAPLNALAQDEAARIALLLEGGVRAAMGAVPSTVQRTIVASETALTAEDAAIVLRDSTVAAVQAALLVTFRGIRAGAKDQRARFNSDDWQQFFANTGNEERLAAALALVRGDWSDDVVAATFALDAAIALRPFAQERPLASPVMTVAEIASQYGVRVRLDAGVDSTARQRSLFILQSALTDLRSVIPTLDFTGLTIEIGPIDANASHLAFHEPRKRMIRLDPATMAGTLAHELAHDLDWQLAARKYNTRSNYATDYATQNRRALAYAVEGLTGNAAPMSQPPTADAAARRPAEMFARRFEWYVASALALNGRSSGYLSSAQSDWIPGYGAAVRPDPAPASARAFAALVAEATSMDRMESAAVERTVMESAPAAVRVIQRIASATDLAQFQRQTMAELHDWECASPWHALPDAQTGMRWFVEALAAAAFPPTVANAAGANGQSILNLAAVRAVARGSRLEVRGAGCSPLGGVLIAQSVR